MITRDMASTYIKERCIGSANKPDGTMWSEAMWMAIKALQEPEIVRCKECKHRDENCGFGEHKWCKQHNGTTAQDDYCSCGERIERNDG